MPLGVASVFVALVLWAGLAMWGVWQRRFMPALLFGVAFMLALNIGYVINGPVASIANFIGIYDVLINLGLPATAAAVMPCAGNACTVWGETFTQHPAWGVAFYDRFANGSDMRSTLLMGHIIGNSIVFVLMHIQMAYPGGSGQMHRLLGRASFAILTLGVGCAAILASQHGTVTEYGGLWAEWGFFSMSAVVYGCAVVGVLAIRGADAAKHRVWMWRFVGSMWGAFWLFRVVLFVIDPLLRQYEGLAINVCIWGSAPAGAIIADLIRRRIDAPRTRAAAQPAE